MSPKISYISHTCVLLLFLCLLQICMSPILVYVSYYCLCLLQIRMYPILVCFSSSCVSYKFVCSHTYVCLPYLCMSPIFMYVPILVYILHLPILKVNILNSKIRSTNQADAPLRIQNHIWKGLVSNTARSTGLHAFCLIPWQSP
jgi:hypothetical protein